MRRKLRGKVGGEAAGGKVSREVGGKAGRKAGGGAARGKSAPPMTTSDVVLMGLQRRHHLTHVKTKRRGGGDPMSGEARRPARKEWGGSSPMSEMPRRREWIKVGGEEGDTCDGSNVEEAHNGDHDTAVADARAEAAEPWGALRVRR